jgi:hypothetical protein
MAGPYRQKSAGSLDSGALTGRITKSYRFKCKAIMVDETVDATVRALKLVGQQAGPTSATTEQHTRSFLKLNLEYEPTK